jgi:hypothetical protein
VYLVAGVGASQGNLVPRWEVENPYISMVLKIRCPVLKKQLSSADTVSICTLEEEARQTRYCLCNINWRDSLAYSNAAFVFTITVFCFSKH